MFRYFGNQYVGNNNYRDDQIKTAGNRSKSKNRRAGQNWQQKSQPNHTRGGENQKLAWAAPKKRVPAADNKDNQRC